MASCEICRGIGAEARWGEAVGENLPTRPPAEVARLTEVSNKERRCPLCGNRFEYRFDSVLWLNNDYDCEFVRRLLPPEYPEKEQRAAFERVRADLTDDDPRGRGIAIDILGKVSTKEAEALRPSVRAMVGDADASVRRSAIDYLVRGSADLTADVKPLFDSPFGDVRLRAGALLTTHFLGPAKRTDEAVSLLRSASGEALTGVLESFVAAGDRATLFGVIAERLRNGDSFRVTPQVLATLVESLADADASLRQVAWEILNAFAQRGDAISATFEALVKRLGCHSSSPEDLITEVIKEDRDVEPLVRWLALLAYSNAGRAVTLLRDLLDRGQDVSAAAEVLRRLPAKDAQALLEAMESPAALEVAKQYADVFSGKLTIGGVDPNGIEWILYFDRGGFSIEFRFGDEGRAQPISAARVRSILARKAYRWQQAR